MGVSGCFHLSDSPSCQSRSGAASCGLMLRCKSFVGSKGGPETSFGLFSVKRCCVELFFVNVYCSLRVLKKMHNHMTYEMFVICVRTFGFVCDVLAITH